MRTALLQRSYPVIPPAPRTFTLGHGVARVARLTGRAGYLELTAFAHGAAARHAVASALRQIGDAPAIILDLRRHRGGEETMASFITSCFFPTEPMALERYAVCPGNPAAAAGVPRIVGPSLDILVSRETSTLARKFAENLRRLGRARVVGPAPRR
jgi:C-terminal processing protease CtpA/Prc